MHGLRELDLKKAPSISETLDWARALLALNATELDERLVQDTLNVILKYEGDIRKAQAELGRLLERKPEPPEPAKPGRPGPAKPEPAASSAAPSAPKPAASSAAPPAPKPAAKKGRLH
jgi:hypothetical protein